MDNLTLIFNEYESISPTNNDIRLASEPRSRFRVVYTRNAGSRYSAGGRDLVEVFTETFDEARPQKSPGFFIFQLQDQRIS